MVDLVCSTSGMVNNTLLLCTTSFMFHAIALVLLYIVLHTGSTVLMRYTIVAICYYYYTMIAAPKLLYTITIVHSIYVLYNIL